MTFRQLRFRRGFETAKSLADASRQNQSTVNKIEGGYVPDPRYMTVKSLADAMGVEMAVVKRAIDATVRAREASAA